MPATLCEMQRNSAPCDVDLPLICWVAFRHCFSLSLTSGFLCLVSQPSAIFIFIFIRLFSLFVQLFFCVSTLLSAVCIVAIMQLCLSFKQRREEGKKSHRLCFAPSTLLLAVHCKAQRDTWSRPNAIHNCDRQFTVLRLACWSELQHTARFDFYSTTTKTTPCRCRLGACWSEFNAFGRVEKSEISLIRNGSCRAQRVFALAILSPLSRLLMRVCILQKITRVYQLSSMKCSLLSISAPTTLTTTMARAQARNGQRRAPHTLIACDVQQIIHLTKLRRASFFHSFAFISLLFTLAFYFFCLTHFILSSLSPSTLDFQAHTNLSCNYRWKHRKSSEIYTQFLPLLRPMINSF